jgi:15-cis-phytoene synthase
MAAQRMTVQESYAWATKLARERAKNFYYAFLLLPAAKRRSLCAIYAFMRIADDLSDGGAASASGMKKFRQQLDAALDAGSRGSLPKHILWPAFVDTVERYSIPRRYFHELIDGVESDLTFVQPETFDDLYRYCYHVASVVGLVVIHIYGFGGNTAALRHAEHCGIAFQLTNIIRDVAEDFEAGRVYLPRQLQIEYHLKADALIRPDMTPELQRLLAHLAGKARSYYDAGHTLTALLDKDARPAHRAMVGIYEELLDRIESSSFHVLSERIRVPTWRKLTLLASSYFR